MSKSTTQTTNVSDTPIDGGSVQTRTTVTRTTYESEVPVYRPLLTPRTTIINRTSYSAPEKKNTLTRHITTSSNIPAGAYSNMTRTGVNNVKNDREKEKKDMQDLNERLGGYIEKVRFLEAQNRKLVDELDKLKQKWGKETGAIKAMYQAELDEARKLLDEAEKEKARLEIRCASLEEQIEELRRKLDDANSQLAQDKDKLQRQDQQLSDYEAELNLLRRRVESLENDRDKDKKEIARLQDALNRARIDLDNETLNHVDAENRRQTLEEELEFLKQVQEQEMKELQALAYRDTTQENRDFWKNEMGGALRDIQHAYEEKIDEMKEELEKYYNMKIQEFRTGAARQNIETVHAKEESKKLRDNLNDLRKRLADAEAKNAMLEKELDHLKREFSDKEREWEEENAHLKDEVAQLRAEMEAILKELQDLMDAKLGLELEIAAYRKMLEGEETRIGMKDVVSNLLGKGDKKEDDGKPKA